MNVQTSAESEGRLTEWLLRLFALMVYGLAVRNLALGWWSDTSRVSLLLLLLTEGYTLGLVLVARQAQRRDMAPLTVAATAYATFFLALLTSEGTQHLAPEWVGVGVQMLGLACQFSAKLTLGRSFGLLPAQRGIVIAGPYRLVRHPMYLGYFISHVGFLLVNWSLRNLAVFAVLYAAQGLRIVREEAVLGRMSDYRAYQRRVRWRLLPGLF